MPSNCCRTWSAASAIRQAPKRVTQLPRLKLRTLASLDQLVNLTRLSSHHSFKHVEPFLQRTFSCRFSVFGGRVTQPEPPADRRHLQHSTSTTGIIMSLRLTPYPANPASTAPSLGAPSAPGIHDTLRHNLGLTPTTSTASSAPAKALSSTHPLEARLSAWRATQDALKMEGLRRAYGLAEPIRRGMELHIARSGEWRPMALGSGGVAGVHEDVLSGRDCELGWEDVFRGDELRPLPDFHSEMEARCRMMW